MGPTRCVALSAPPSARRSTWSRSEVARVETVRVDEVVEGVGPTLSATPATVNKSNAPFRISGMGLFVGEGAQFGQRAAR